MQNTVVVPFTRKWCVEPFFKNLNEMIVPSETEIIFYVDTNDQELYESVNAKRPKGFESVKTIWGKNGNHINDSIPECRRRIANVHESLKPLIKGEVVIGIEDDTLSPANTLTRLTELVWSPAAGYVQGVEVGRRGYRVFGVWLKNGDTISTAAKGTGVEEVTAGGFYCFAVHNELYQNHKFDSSLSEYSFLGPDFNFGYSIRQKGYKCLTDWDLECIHLTEDEEITVHNYHHIASWIKDGNQWRRNLVVVDKL